MKYEYRVLLYLSYISILMSSITSISSRIFSETIFQPGRLAAFIGIPTTLLVSIFCLSKWGQNSMEKYFTSLYPDHCNVIHLLGILPPMLFLSGALITFTHSLSILREYQSFFDLEFNPNGIVTDGLLILIQLLTLFSTAILWWRIGKQQLSENS